MYKLVVRNKLPVNVKGTLTGENGEAVEFAFTLFCKRLNQDEIDQARNGTESIKQFLQRVTEGWKEVVDDADQPVVFSTENFDQVLNNDAGMRAVCYQAYLAAVSAVAKN